MRASWVTVAATLFAWGVALPLTGQGKGAEEPTATNPFTPFDRAAFEKRARALGAGDAAIATYETACVEESVAHATEGLLRDLIPALEAAITLAEDGAPRAALELASILETTESIDVRAHARYHLGRHFLDADDPELAVITLVAYLRQDKNHTPLDAEAAFFYGTALAEIPRPGDAAATLGDFLELFPNAPERYRAVAAQRKAELEAQFESPLHAIADSMKGLRRDVRDRKFEKAEGRGDEAKDLLQRQQDVLEELQKIIEQLEEQEKQSSGGAGGSSSSNPAATSSLPGGEGRIGKLDNAPRVAKRWGNMKDREREAIEADVQTRLSGPWKKMAEEYYKKLNKGAKR